MLCQSFARIHVNNRVHRNISPVCNLIRENIYILLLIVEYKMIIKSLSLCLLVLRFIIKLKSCIMDQWRLIRRWTFVESKSFVSCCSGVSDPLQIKTWFIRMFRCSWRSLRKLLSLLTFCMCQRQKSLVWKSLN